MCPGRWKALPETQEFPVIPKMMEEKWGLR